MSQITTISVTIRTTIPLQPYGGITFELTQTAGLAEDDSSDIERAYLLESAQAAIADQVAALDPSNPAIRAWFQATTWHGGPEQDGPPATRTNPRSAFRDDHPSGIAEVGPED